MSWMCSLCNDLQFMRKKEYLIHMEKHQKGKILPTEKKEDKAEIIDPATPIKKIKVDPETGIVTGAPTEVSLAVEATEVIAVPSPVVQKEEVKLTYVYRGTCGKCGSLVDTILLDTDKETKQIAVAWCPKCREKISQQKVDRL